MPLRFLIIHESVIIRNIIQQYITADHSEAVADVSASSEDAIRMLKQEKYDVILSGLEMPRMDGLAVHKHIRRSGRNKNTPMIMMTPTDNKARREQLSKQGIKYLLPIPFTSVQFRNLIYNVFHPEGPDIDIFFNIPRTRAIIHIKENHQIPADVVHISMDSVICELICSEEPDDLMRAGQIIVRFPVDYGKAIVIHITGNLVEFRDKSWAGDAYSHHQRLRITWKIAWKFLELSTATKRTLKMPLGQPSASSPDFHKYIQSTSPGIDSLAKENEKLRTGMDALVAEKQELLLEVSRLRKKVSELRKADADMLLRDISLSSLINEVAKRSDNPSKKPIFKQIIEDNVKLRQGTGVKK
ncbi:response regulator [Desulfonema magnum]|uniref:Two component system response regulator domain-containing protein n=1 Tax=Desulfonema magnum TaxID=45655 RepID=A0A975BMV6_9BACT|nr:response regulator [Desulfonema magnum]QTA88441.1 Two component system response regulator domain-containing protein [Desulfonema magnum]